MEVRCPFCFLCCFRCCGAVPSWVALRDAPALRHRWRVCNSSACGHGSRLPLRSKQFAFGRFRVLACELSVCLLLARRPVGLYARLALRRAAGQVRFGLRCAPWGWRCRAAVRAWLRGSVSSPARGARWPSGAAANTCSAGRAGSPSRRACCWQPLVSRLPQEKYCCG